MAKNSPQTWSPLRSYSDRQIDKVALPLAGIGTGGVSLGGRGDLRDWELMSRPGKGYTPCPVWDLAPVSPFFAVRVARSGEAPQARLLEGPYADHFCEAAMGSSAPNHGMPRFEEAVFDTTYPFGKVSLKDRSFPLQASVEAFNPLVPGDSEASSLPVAAFRITLSNKTSQAIESSVCFSLPNFIGDDGEEITKHCFQWSEKMLQKKRNWNEYRSDQRLRGIYMQSEELDKNSDTWGTLAIATDHRGQCSHRTTWAPFDGGDSRQEFWDDLLTDGKLENFENDKFPHPCGTLCAAVKLPPRSERTVQFYLTWHFPNRQAWTKKPEGETEPCGTDCGCAPKGDPDNVGNHYAQGYSDAWEAMQRIVPQLKALEKKTAAFVNTITQSDLPSAIQEAALFNLSTLRSPTVFRINSGHLCGYEGVFDHMGCCAGSCTHVWNYETATGGLFGELAQTMREVEFKYCTNDEGRQCFRAPLPFNRKQELAFLAADGQMGTIVRFYREWQRSGDEDFLRAHWPKVRKALEFCWIPGGWDADRDGVMEGCQHNTMDVEYLGPNPQMTGWYLAALRACEAMADHLGEDEFADICRKLAESGSAGMSAQLFNGDYYEHKIVPLPRKKIAEGLMLNAGAAAGQDPEKPFKQLGAGCLVDQLVGVYQAQLNGLPEIIPAKEAKQTLRSILKFNFRKDFKTHFNHLRSYVSPEDAGLVMASYPRGQRPERPFPYWNEVMTGFEYTAAGHMLAMGLEKEGLRCIEAIRARYDGRRRNPFNETECGYHYARAMAAWSTLEAWSGFHYSAVARTLRFKAREGRYPWSTGYAWGTVELKQNASGWQVDLNIEGGKLNAKTFQLTGIGETSLSAAKNQRLKLTPSKRSRIQL